MRLPPGRFSRCASISLVLAVLSCLAGWVTAALAADERLRAAVAESLAADGDPWIIHVDSPNDADSDGSPDAVDCDDTNPAVYPGAPQVCDGVNNDCDDANWPHLFAWGRNVIPLSTGSPGSAFVADMDGDGDPDLLYADSDPDTIAWLENLAGDGSVWEEHTISLASGSVFPTDVDADGDLDALSASYYDGKVAWHENMTGDGSAWVERTIFTSDHQFHSVSSADVDGDGDMDVVSAFDDSDFAILWHENTTGDGTDWLEHTVTTDARDAPPLIIADMDGDGDPDILSAWYNGTSDEALAWHENVHGDGTDWASRTISEEAGDTHSVFAADIDGDGDLDALAVWIDAFGDRHFTWHENLAGDASRWTTRTIMRDTRVYGTSTTDLDGDGDQDVLASTSDDEMLWFDNAAGDGSSWIVRWIGDARCFWRGLSALDLDEDGDSDLLPCRTYSGILWYSRDSIETDDDGDGLRECDGDCDDGNPDCTLDCTDADSDGYAACEGDCDDTEPEVHPGHAEGPTSYCADGLDNDCDGLIDDEDPGCPQDADSDGYYDLPYIGSEDDDCDDTNPAIYPGAPQVCGDGVNNDCLDSYWPDMWWWDKHPIATGDESYDESAAGDLDGDGDSDVLAFWIEPIVRKLGWYENVTGDGSVWAEHTIVTVEGYVDEALLVDVDGDGDLDALSAALPPVGLEWYENTAGDGSAWTQWTISDLADPSGAFAADLDGDGDPDVISRTIDETFVWYENVSGDGTTWVDHVIASVAPWGRSPFAADLDGDGDLDVLAIGTGESGLGWHENTEGDGSLWTEHPIGVAMDVHAADLDGDGDQDLLTTIPHEFSPISYYTIHWLENVVGDGLQWTEHEIGVGGYIEGWAVPADIDGDGDVDVLESKNCSYDDGYVSWHENTAGDGSAWTKRRIDVGNCPSGALAADVDGDGDLDALYTLYNALAGVPPLGWYDRLPLEADADSDSVCEPDDCDDEDELTWAVPGEVLDLVFHGDRETLSWTEPEVSGRVGGPLYDTLRTTVAADFVNAATCVEWGDDSDTQATDSDIPPTGTVYHYLVCATSSCGSGPAGTDSDGVERILRVCP